MKAAVSPAPGVELVWSDGTGYRCPNCSLFVALTKSEDPRYCPRCPAPSERTIDAAYRRASRRILGADVMGDFSSPTKIAARASFRLGWNAALAATEEVEEHTDPQTVEEVVRHLDELLVEMNRTRKSISPYEDGAFWTDFDEICRRWHSWRAEHRSRTDPIAVDLVNALVPSSATLNVRLMIGSYFRSFVFTRPDGDPLGHGRREIQVGYFLDPEGWENEAISSGRYRHVSEIEENPRWTPRSPHEAQLRFDEVRLLAAELGFDLIEKPDAS